jgi:hypothetical protein
MQAHDEDGDQQLHEAGKSHHDCGEQPKVKGCCPAFGEHSRGNGIHVYEAHGQREEQGMDYESAIVGYPHQYIPLYVEYSKVICLWVLQSEGGWHLKQDSHEPCSETGQIFLIVPTPTVHSFLDAPSKANYVQE